MAETVEPRTTELRVAGHRKPDYHKLEAPGAELHTMSRHVETLYVMEPYVTEHRMAGSLAGQDATSRDGSHES